VADEVDGGADVPVGLAWDRAGTFLVVAQEAIGGVGAVVEDQVPAHVAEVDADGTPRGVGPIDDRGEPAVDPEGVAGVVVAVDEARRVWRWWLREDLPGLLPDVAPQGGGAVASMST
jgi:hypothetical protein